MLWLNVNGSAYGINLSTYFNTSNVVVELNYKPNNADVANKFQYIQCCG